nr:uncharacterized protein LOC109768189 [Aegilops tauschii subsp. strangulata]
MGVTPEVRTPSRRRFAKAASAPCPLEAGAASSSILDAEVTSVAPADWVRGGGTGPLNQAILDVQGKLRAEADALKQCNQAFLESRAAVRDYHNLHAAAFNSKVQELNQRTVDLSESRKANAALQQQLGEANTALHAQEVECNKLAQERDRLTTQLAEQAELLKKAQQEAEAKESNLLAEFETERSAGTDKEALLTAGFGEIEDMVDDFFPGHSGAANQAIEADREGRRTEGAVIAADAPRTLSEQLLSIQAHLRPSHRMLHRLQRVGAQAIAALWPYMPAPHTPSRTADWLEVAADRLEAWKGSSARARARRALEFVNAWYPGLNLAQLATLRLEAQEQLVAVERDLVQQAAAIAEYTNTSVFVPELAENGIEAPQEWFGLNPEDGKDSAEVIDSSDEGEDEEDKEGEEEAPEVEADGQPQLDRASSNEPRPSEPPAARGDQAETDQPAAPPTGTTDSTVPPNPPAAP